MQFLGLTLVVLVGVLAAEFVSFKAHQYYVRYRSARSSNPIFPLPINSTDRTVRRLGEEREPAVGTPVAGRPR